MIKKCRDCKIEKDSKEFYKVKSSKDGLHSYCKSCISVRCKRYRKENEKEVKARKKKYASSKRGKLQKKKHRERCKDYYKTYNSKYFQENKDELYEKRKEYKKEWFNKNPHIRAFYSSEYRARKSKASIDSTDEIKINKIHEKCKRLSSLKGEEYNVDHIIPLNHPKVCGLHVHWNLQILTKSENTKKSNKFDGTYENESWKRVNYPFDINKTEIIWKLNV